MKHSKMIQNALKEFQKRGGDPHSICDSTCTAGFDNDGSTGLEIFENGIELGAAAFGDYGPDAPPGYGEGKIYYAEIDDVIFFFLGDEDKIIERIKTH